MRSPFSRRGSKKSFTNGPNTERSVWIGGTTLVAPPRIDREKEESGESSEVNISSINSSSSSENMFRKDGKNDAHQREKKPSLIQRIKALSPRRDDERDDANDDASDTFFSPVSNAPATSTAPTDRKSRSSVSIGGETIIDEGTSSSSSSNRRLKPKRRSHVTSRRKRSTSTSNSSGKSGHLFSSVTSLDIPSCALTLSSLEESEGIHHLRGSFHEEEGLDLEAALIPRDGDDVYENDEYSYSDSRQIATAPSRIGSKRKKYKEGQRRVSSSEGQPLYNRKQQQLQANNITGVKRRRLSKRARTRLTMREVNSNIQPGRNDSVLDESMGALEKRKAITLPKTIDFFLRIEMKLIAVNTMVSVLLTVLVLTTFPESWQTGMKESSRGVSLLGAFLSFALVFRTQSCYQRWWEARTQWGKMTATCVNVAGQCLTWFADEELIDRFLTHCIVFPYACKAVLRGNALTSSSEEGPRFLQSGMLTDADLGVIVRHGTFPPFTCIDIMRRTMQEELLQSHSKLSSEAVNGAYLAMENSFNELYFNFGACAKIKSTQMPASYTVFMRSFVFFFFIFSTLSWAPTIKYLTPIITCFMVFLINTVIVIGDQMMRPFTLTWSGLPIKKFCVMIEQEVLSVSRRQGDIERLVRS